MSFRSCQRLQLALCCCRCFCSWLLRAATYSIVLWFTDGIKVYVILWGTDCTKVDAVGILGGCRRWWWPAAAD